MIFVLLIMLINIVYGQQQKIIEIGKSYNETIEDPKQQKFYEFSVTSNTNNNDLIITVFPIDQMENFCDPDLYINKVKN